MHVQERYTPKVIAANSINTISPSNIGGFLCTVSGTITLVSNGQDGADDTTFFTAMAVTAGNYYPMPFYIGKSGGVFTTAGGAAGVLAN